MRIEQDGDVELRALAPGDATRLLGVYAVARVLADQLRGALAGYGLTEEAASVAPGINAADEPVVHVTVTCAAAARLVALLASGGGPPPRYAVPTHPPSDGPPRAA